MLYIFCFQPRWLWELRKCSCKSQVYSIQSLNHVWFFVAQRTAAHQVSLSITNSRCLLKLMSIESVMPSNHLIILCCPLLLLPSVFPSIRVFSNESGLLISWPKYWSFSFSISPCNEHTGLISFRMDWLDPLADPTNLVHTRTQAPHKDWDRTVFEHLLWRYGPAVDCHRDGVLRLASGTEFI